MRISDWSSDVCSSDLHLDLGVGAHLAGGQDEGVDAHHHLRDREGGDVAELAGLGDVAGDGADDGAALVEARVVDGEVVERLDAGRVLEVDVGELLGDAHRGVHEAERSEEHTSELQSLMRISYAVFCLKKKTKNQNKTKESV